MLITFVKFVCNYACPSDRVVRLDNGHHSDSSGGGEEHHHHRAESGVGCSREEKQHRLHQTAISGPYVRNQGGRCWGRILTGDTNGDFQPALDR